MKRDETAARILCALLQHRDIVDMEAKEIERLVGKALEVYLAICGKPKPKEREPHFGDGARKDVVIKLIADELPPDLSETERQRRMQSVVSMVERLYSARPEEMEEILKYRDVLDAEIKREEESELREDEDKPE